MNNKSTRFFIAFIICACIDFIGKNIFEVYPIEQQERVYCIWQSISFDAYILIIYFLVREYKFKPMTYFVFNWFGFALSDTYQEVFGDPYALNYFEYFPLYLSVIITSVLLLKTPDS